MNASALIATGNAAGFPILSLITWLPLVGCVVIMLVRGDEETVASNARWTALWTSLLVLILSLVLWVRFDPSDAGFQFNEHVAWLPEYKVGYSMGVDGISVLFVLLSTLLTPICILASWESIHTRVREFMISFLILETMMVGMFCAHRFRRVLHVLRGRADPDVSHHRRLGRSAAGLCRGQVLPLHPDRLGADAAGADRHVGAGRHHRYPDPDAHRVPARRCRPGCSWRSSPPSR